MNFRRLAAVLDGKQVAPSVRLYVSTSRFVFDIASDLGAVDVIERAGGIVLQDTCTYFTPRGSGLRRPCRHQFGQMGILCAGHAAGRWHRQSGELRALAVRGEFVHDDCS